MNRYKTVFTEGGTHGIVELFSLVTQNMRYSASMGKVRDGDSALDSLFKAANMIPKRDAKIIEMSEVAAVYSQRSIGNKDDYLIAVIGASESDANNMLNKLAKVHKVSKWYKTVKEH